MYASIPEIIPCVSVPEPAGEQRPGARAAQGRRECRSRKSLPSPVATHGCHPTIERGLPDHQYPEVSGTQGTEHHDGLCSGA